MMLAKQGEVSGMFETKGQGKLRKQLKRIKDWAVEGVERLRVWKERGDDGRWDLNDGEEEIFLYESFVYI